MSSELRPLELQNNSSPNLGGFIHAVERYNSQFNLGTTLAEILEDRLDEAEGISVPRETKISIEEIESTYESTIALTGIGVERVNMNPIIGPEETTYTSRVGINLQDGNKYVNYLSSLQADEMDDLTIEALRVIAENLVIQLCSQYDLSDSNDNRMIDLLSHGRGIVDEYRRIDQEGRMGLIDSVSRLDKYIQIAKKGYLREHLAVEGKQLLIPPEDRSFNPAHWQRDITPEGYQDRWNGVFSILEGIRKNPKAGMLYLEVMQNLQRCISFARDDIDNIEKKSDHYRKVMPELRLILTDAEIRLARLEDTPVVG